VTTTCQTIVDRAKSANPLNASLSGDRAEMLSRIRADQQELFSRIAGTTRDRFQTTATITSSSAARRRVLTLSALSPVVERVLRLELPDGREVSQVDVLDPDAELAPRYAVQGETLVEIDNDWSTVSGTVSLSLRYVYGMTDISPDGALSQLVTVPDPWIDLLVLPLAMYFFRKDPGREDAEYVRLAALLGEFEPRSGRRGAFLDYLENYGGVESRRFAQPTPRTTGKR
jgi:hypothetical protein